MDEFLQRFGQWCKDNFITVFFSYEEKVPGTMTLTIDGMDEVFLLVEPKDDNKILDIGCNIAMSDDEYQVADTGAAKYAIFEFGQRFYYTPLKVKKDEWNNMVYPADFEDFKFVGKNACELNIDFVHLGVHSEYELLNGSHKTLLWVKKAKFLNHTAIGICDKNTLAGTLSLQLDCKKSGLKSIFGMTAVVAVDYSEAKDIQTTYEVKLYAMNEEGWQNLLQINKQINFDHNGEFIPEEKLFEYSAGLIAVFPPNSQLNSVRDVKAGKLLIVRYKSKFKHLYYQIDSVEYYDNDTDLGNLTKMKNYLANYRTMIKPILINDSYYLDKEMYPLKEYLNKVDGYATAYSEAQHFKTLDETNDILSPLFSSRGGEYYIEFINEAIQNTVVVSELCNYEIPTGEHKLPRYENDRGISNEELFFQLIEEGIGKKLYHVDDLTVYMERIEKEAGVIVKAGFIDYFLILWDIVSWCKSVGIYVGTARGSIGGCLLAYLIDVIDIDPIKHDLLFERFLNEARVSGERAKAADAMPDVDLDFEMNSRDLVKQYISDRFGEFHTCSIGAYTRLKLKAGIKDFGRVKGLDFGYVNELTKYIDNQLEYTWKDLIQYSLKNDMLYKFIQKYPDIAHCIKFALQQARSSSVHASGVIIVPKHTKDGKEVNIFNWLPIRKNGNLYVSEWEGKFTDRVGFLKEDILGLTQLDKFKKTIQLIKENYDIEINLNEREIPLDDEKTFKLFGKGFTEDVFQFNSSGLKHYSARTKPDCIEDLTAMNALYRPGPMSSNAHMDFAEFKNNPKKKPKYDFGLQSVTEKTQGLYIYQEQIMQAVVVLGGFSLVDADVLRTQIKKFDKVAMAKSENQFVEGAIKKGCDKEEAEKIWNKLVAFSGYGFNKSHSAAYAEIAYFSQWLKANYPLESFTSSLNFGDEKIDIPNILSEMKRIKLPIKVKPPSLNYSGAEFACDPSNKTIYWSLVKIKGLGEASVTKILAEREKAGKFYSYEDFTSRIAKKDVNKNVLKTLILAGAFDEVEGINPTGDTPHDRLGLLKKHLDRVGDELPEEFKKTEIIRKRYFWTGLQKDMSGYGFLDYKQMLMDLNTLKAKKLADKYVEYDKFCDNDKDFRVATIVGIVKFADEGKSKYGKRLVLSMSSNDGHVIVNFWNDMYVKYNEILHDCIGKTIAIRGKIKFNDYRNFNILESYDDTDVMVL